MPRRLRYSVATSLDGFIADDLGGYDWIVMDTEIDFDAFMAKIDALVMGRRTYAVIQGQEDVPGMGTPMYVVSTTLDLADHPDVTIVPAEVEAFVADLKSRDGGDIWLFGGGVLFRSLLVAGLVDRVEVGVIPVLLGSGIPLLPGSDAPVKLRLHSAEQFTESGILLLKYDVEG